MGIVFPSSGNSFNHGRYKSILSHEALFEPKWQSAEHWHVHQESVEQASIDDICLLSQLYRQQEVEAVDIVIEEPVHGCVGT